MFTSSKNKKADIKIIVLQRGWVVVGRPVQTGSQVKVSDCSVVRLWGTTKGLGELALKGPLKDTKLDFCGSIQFHELTTILVMDCNMEAWADYEC